MKLCNVLMYGLIDLSTVLISTEISARDQEIGIASLPTILCASKFVTYFSLVGYRLSVIDPTKLVHLP